jgi:hypothetical protein
MRAMVITKGEVPLVRRTGEHAGRGFCYLASDLPGNAGPRGSVVRLHWEAEPLGLNEPFRLQFSDGRAFDVVCTRNTPAECGPNDILRFVTAEDASGARR